MLSGQAAMLLVRDLIQWWFSLQVLILCMYALSRCLIWFSCFNHIISLLCFLISQCRVDLGLMLFVVATKKLSYLTHAHARTDMYMYVCIYIYIYIYIHVRVRIRTYMYMYICMYAFPCARASKLNQQICISPAPGRSSKLTHTCVEIDTCAFQTGCQLSSAATGMSLELRFLRNFSGVKRTCWTTGSWRSCLSLEVVSSIPAGSTIIDRFLCGFICVSLCQSIKIKPTNMMYMYIMADGSWVSGHDARHSGGRRGYLRL